MIVKLTLDVDGNEFDDFLKKVGLDIEDAEDDPAVIIEFLEHDIANWVIMTEIQ